MREKRLRDKTCSSVSSLIASRYLPTTSEGECRQSASRGDPEDRIFPPGSVKWRNLVVWLARAEGTPAVGAYVCKSARCVYLYDGHIGHRSHPSRVTYANNTSADQNRYETPVPRVPQPFWQIATSLLPICLHATGLPATRGEHLELSTRRFYA